MTWNGHQIRMQAVRNTPDTWVIQCMEKFSFFSTFCRLFDGFWVVFERIFQNISQFFDWIEESASGRPNYLRAHMDRQNRHVENDMTIFGWPILGRLEKWPDRPRSDPTTFGDPENDLPENCSSDRMHKCFREMKGPGIQIRPNSSVQTIAYGINDCFRGINEGFMHVLHLWKANRRSNKVQAGHIS